MYMNMACRERRSLNEYYKDNDILYTNYIKK